jgi:hypothetical protein
MRTQHLRTYHSVGTMAQAVSRRPLTKEARVRSRIGPQEIKCQPPNNN